MFAYLLRNIESLFEFTIFYACLFFHLFSPQVHMVLKELVRKSISETEVGKLFPEQFSVYFYVHVVYILLLSFTS